MADDAAAANRSHTGIACVRRAANAWRHPVWIEPSPTGRGYIVCDRYGNYEYRHELRNVVALAQKAIHLNGGVVRRAI